MAAAASDKARFYMEQSVPELQEYARKGIFTPAEITAIARKRSEFEHLLNMPGAATPSDFARYATYEMNLDALRKKRSRRLGAKSTAYTGQRKVFFVLERGVRKFQGDMGLWMQYLEYCRDEAANKKLAKALTQCLRLHPLRWELWIWAAQYYFDRQADMTTARSYMQRGLRFCKTERKLWLEYTKLEMLYVAKVAARRKILGLDSTRTAKIVDESNDADADEIALPDITAEDVNPELRRNTEAIDEVALQNLASTPALSGAIPKAIFDAAMKQFKDDADLALQFFDLFLGFPDVPATEALLQHVLSSLERASASQHACAVAKRELFGVDASSANFPLGLGRALAVLKKARASLPGDAADIASSTVLLLLPYVGLRDELDEGIVKVLDGSIKQNLRVLQAAPPKRGKTASSVLLQKLRKDGRVPDLKMLTELGLEAGNSGQALMSLPEG